MTFPNDTSTPWAIPLMVLGGLLILAGAALLVLKPKSGDRARSRRRFDRRQPAAAASPAARRPRPRHAASPESAGATAAVPVAGTATPAPRAPPRARPPNNSPEERLRTAAAAPATAAQRLRRSGAVVAVLTATAVAGSGVAAQASQTPAPSPARPRAAAGAGRRRSPVLLDAQFRRILEQVASAVDAGDAAKDASKLEPRVAGPELEVRTQNYKIRSQVGSYEARMPVRATKLLTTVVTEQAQPGRARSWPSPRARATLFRSCSP